MSTHLPTDRDDPSSDSDLDLNELDPTTATTSHPTSRRQPSSSSRLSYDFNRIPLRNLRFGGRRRPPRDEEAEDLQALVGEQDAEREGKREWGGGDDAPLLANGRGRGDRGEDNGIYPFSAEDRFRRRRGGFMRYLPFLRGKRHTSAIALPSSSTPDNDTDDDHNPSTTRTIHPGASNPKRTSNRFPPNTISNAKYTPLNFLPLTLYHEFKFFLNLYFLLVALSQIIPALRIGYLSTYVAPLAFVVSVTLGKEAWDDVLRRRRDGEANGEGYRVLVFDEGGLVGGGKGRKRKIKTITERKRGKRRRTEDDGGEVVESFTRAAEREGEAGPPPSSSVREVMKASKDLKIGDVVVLGKDQRVPADVIVLKSFSTETATEQQHKTTNEDAGMEASSDTTLVDMGSNATSPNSRLQREAAAGLTLDNDTTSTDPSGGGEAFIRTDQLDGETDWKLRLASPLAQTLPVSEYVRLRLTAGKPDRRVNDFAGTIELLPHQNHRQEGRRYDPHISRPNGHPPTPLPTAAADPPKSSPLTIDNTAWANTVLASSTTVHAVVVYTGRETRSALSTSPSRSKTGLLEHEINSLTKILCILTAALSFILVMLEGFEPKKQHNFFGSGSTGAEGGQEGKWYVAVLRFLILFSTIVPISLRVNLDMGKSVYAWFIHHDPDMEGAVVRTSTIPEDLGRIEFLLTDKTGTLTRNEMVLKKVHVGTVSYGGEAMEEVGGYVRQAFTVPPVEDGKGEGLLFTPKHGSSGFQLSGTTRTRREIGVRVRDLVLALALCHNVTPTTEEDAQGEAVTAYQASSPDEIAIVQWTEHVGLRLAHRDRRSMSLTFTTDGRVVVRVEVLQLFPFTSEGKRMGVIVRFCRRTRRTMRNRGDEEEEEIVFFQKGADTVMSSIVAANDWLDEETANMAREGLRTLVIGRRNLSKQQYDAFATAYGEAALSLQGRDAAMARVVKMNLEHDLELLGVTGVEDKLQPHVKPSLELLRNAGVKIWMLTGDKVETARCVAVSSKLVSRGQYIHTIAGLKRKEAALDALSLLHSQPHAALLIDGQSLALYLQHHRETFITLAVRLPAVIACRCSPTQKAELAHLIRAFTKKRIACIGDGGNDVSMIQAADVGVGIVGKEGRQASLAADFSITQFAHLTKLLVWHGRNSYKRSAKLAQFVIHRGLIISVCQTVFSVASHFEPIALYRDWLLVGYATVYTMAPVFSLVLDRDVDEGLANLYPELYKELTLGRSLSYRSFFIWVGISIYQGLIIQGGSELLVPSFTNPNPNPNQTQNLTTTPGFRRMVAVSYTVLVVNELIMVAAEVTTWHPIMIFSILGTAMVYFGSLPFLGGYFELSFLLEVGFWWRFVAVLAASLVPVYAGKIIRRTVRPPSYRKVSGV